MWIPLLTAVFLSISTIHAENNVTIDNSDPSIIYTGIWAVSSLTGYDYGGTQELVDLGNNLAGPGANSIANFTFTGVAIYYMSPMWPYAVNTVLTLDDEPPITVDMTAPGTHVPIGSTGASVVSSVLWGRTGLANTQHSLVISLAPGGRYIVVDALIYTAVSPSTSSGGTISTSASGSSSSSSSSSTPLPLSTSANDKRYTALVAIASSMGTLFALTFIAFMVFLVIRRPREKQPDRETVSNVSPFMPEPVLNSGRLSEKGKRLYGYSPRTSTTTYTPIEARSVPSSSTTRYPDMSSQATPRPQRHPEGRTTTQSDTASIALTTGPPPYQ